MKMLSILTRVGLIGLAVVMITTVMNLEMWATDPAGSPTTAQLAESLLVDWSFAFVLLGALLAMAMVGAAYLVRDERRENLEWEREGGEV